MPSSYIHLGLEERRRICRLREAKVPVAEIAAALGRHRATIHREIARNSWHDAEVPQAEVPQAEGYWPLTAQDLAVRRRRAGAKLERHAELREAVIDRLRAGWSPEQIAGRLGVEPGARQRLCHETIYRFVHGPAGQSEELARHLPRRRRRRRPRHARKPRSPVFPGAARIRHRPATVADRAEFGHWGEVGPWPLRGRVSPPNDLMMVRREHGLANFTTLVKRRSRYIVLLRNNDRQSKPIVGRLIDELGVLPAAARRSITFDRGSEFAAWRALEPGLGAKAWLGRSSGALAEGYGGEHQPASAAPPAARHRRADGDGSGHRRPARPAQRHAPQVPRMAHPGRDLPRPPHGTTPARLIPWPGPPSHFD